MSDSEQRGKRRAIRMPLSDRRKSMRFAMMAAALGIIGKTCLGGSILILAAKKLNANDGQIGLLQFLENLAFMCPIFMLWAVEKYGKRKILIFWGALSILFSVPFIFIGQLESMLGPSMLLWLVLLLAMGRGISTGFSNTGWFPLLHDLVPRRITGRFFANLRVSWNVAWLITILTTAAILGKNPQWWHFQAIFLVGVIAYILRFVSIAPVKERPPLHPDQPPRLNLISRFVEVVKDKRLRSLLFYTSGFIISMMVIAPFRVSMLKNLEYSDGFIQGATAMSCAGAVLSLRIWGKLADKFGNRSVFALSHIGIPISLAAWIFVGPKMPWLVLALFFINSVVMSGNQLAQTRYQLHMISFDQQNRINVFNMMTGFLGSISVLGAGFLLSALAPYMESFNQTLHIEWMDISNYDVLFLICTVISVMTFFLRKSLRQDREASTTDVLKEATRPIQNAVDPVLHPRQWFRQQKQKRKERS